MDEVEDVRESERRIIRTPLILGHLSPDPPSHFYPDLLDSLRLQNCTPPPHGHYSLVSADTDHRGFTRRRTATRPRAKGQRFISQLSCDVSLTSVETKECTRLYFLRFSATKCHRDIGKVV